MPHSQLWGPTLPCHHQRIIHHYLNHVKRAVVELERLTQSGMTRNHLWVHKSSALRYVDYDLKVYFPGDRDACQVASTYICLGHDARWFLLEEVRWLTCKGCGGCGEEGAKDIWRGVSIQLHKYTFKVPFIKLSFSILPACHRSTTTPLQVLQAHRSPLMSCNVLGVAEPFITLCPLCCPSSSCPSSSSSPSSALSLSYQETSFRSTYL